VAPRLLSWRRNKNCVKRPWSDSLLDVGFCCVSLANRTCVWLRRYSCEVTDDPSYSRTLGCTEVLHGFPQSIQENYRTFPRTHKRPLPSTVFPIHYLRNIPTDLIWHDSPGKTNLLKENSHKSHRFTNQKFSWQLRTALLWVIMQRVLVIPYRRFGKPIGPILRVQESKRKPVPHPPPQKEII
jgi:hypothetical protein